MMENGHTPCADTCKPADLAEHSQANGCGQGCNGGTCQDRETPNAPTPRGTDCSSIYCDPVAAAGRPVSALERKMCFKCKTSKAEVRYCVDWRKLTTLFCTGIKAQGRLLTSAGSGEAAGAVVLGLLSVQLGKDCEAYNTHQVPDRSRGQRPGRFVGWLFLLGAPAAPTGDLRLKAAGSKARSGRKRPAGFFDTSYISLPSHILYGRNTAAEVRCGDVGDIQAGCHTCR